MAFQCRLTAQPLRHVFMLEHRMMASLKHGSQKENKPKGAHELTAYWGPLYAFDGKHAHFP